MVSSRGNYHRQYPIGLPLAKMVGHPLKKKWFPIGAHQVPRWINNWLIFRGNSFFAMNKSASDTGCLQWTVRLLALIVNGARRNQKLGRPSKHLANGRVPNGPPMVGVGSVGGRVQRIPLLCFQPVLVEWYCICWGASIQFLESQFLF